jgi:hypothetical protein
MIPGGLLQMLKCAADALDVFRQKTTGWRSASMCTDPGQQVVAVVEQPEIGDGAAMMVGRLPSLPLELRALWRAAAELDDRGPGDPVSASLAWVSSLTGVSPPRRIRASTRRGSFGSRRSDTTSPTLIPLYCTELPLDRPLTASLNTTS